MASILNTNNALNNQIQDFQIEGITYRINTYWNVRSGWYVSIFDQDGIDILTGLLCVPDYNLTWRYSRAGGLFPGDLWVIDNEPTKGEPVINQGDFGDGKRFQLIYFTQTEMNDGDFNPRS